jgi:general secretion pathway protein L
MRRSSPHHTADAAVADRRSAAGVWSIASGDIVEVERFESGAAIVLVPTELVLLLTAALPLPGLRRRVEALPFAIEDRIAEPLGAVHIALGAELSPQRHLAGVVSHEVMRGWLAEIDAAGLSHARIVPDALAVPMPATGLWSVDLAGDRALVRSDDGTGLALPAAHLAAAWVAAGRPRCISYGNRLPIEMAGDVGTAESLASRLADPALDLRQGTYGLRRDAMPALAKRIAIVAAFGLIAHGAIAAADTLALNHIAARRAAETRTLLAQIAPDVVIGDDVAASAADLLPENGGKPSAFLPLLVRAGAALGQIGPAASLHAIAFDAAFGTLTLQVEATDMAGLQRVSGALRAQGLSADSGPTSTSQGKTTGAFMIRNPS